MVFSLDEASSFDPLDLDLEVTPANTLKVAPAPLRPSSRGTPRSVGSCLCAACVSLPCVGSFVLRLLTGRGAYGGQALDEGRLLDALMMALRLNEAEVLRAVYERVPASEVLPGPHPRVPNSSPTRLFVCSVCVLSDGREVLVGGWGVRLARAREGRERGLVGARLLR